MLTVNTIEYAVYVGSNSAVGFNAHAARQGLSSALAYGHWEGTREDTLRLTLVRPSDPSDYRDLIRTAATIAAYSDQTAVLIVRPALPYEPALYRASRRAAQPTDPGFTEVPETGEAYAYVPDRAGDLIAVLVGQSSGVYPLS